MKQEIKIGTRSSKLAVWQSNYISEELKKTFPGLEVNLKEIKTKGDHITDVALSKIGGKGLFTKEIEDALLNKEIDLAVHSLKDLPTKLPEGLKIGAVLNRENPSDVLISRDKIKFKELKKDSIIGTSSLRRISQLKALRSDLRYIDLRGNLDTRIRKLEEGLFDAIVLAYAGVKRLRFENKITEIFSPKEILPAVGQGSLAVEIRENDKRIEELILKLNNSDAYMISVIERAFLETLQGGCQVPIGAYSEIEKNKIVLYGLVASLDGKTIVRDSIEGKTEIAGSRNLGKTLAERLLQNGADRILKEIQQLS